MTTMNCNGILLDLRLPIVMGILNITPDSFFDGGKYVNIQQALLKADQMISEGVTIIDIGGMSSRPGAVEIGIKEELTRVIPIIEEIKAKYPTQLISIDTVQSEVAEKSIIAGASIVNDISGGVSDSRIYNICAKYKTPYILMHMKGTPKTMQDDPFYNDVILEILTFFKNRIVDLKRANVSDIIIDPGFGFGKNIDQNYKILKRFSSFSMFGYPLLAGLSRKSMLYDLLEVAPSSSLNATTAAHMIALQNGAKILRVHDVKEAMECIAIFSKV